MLNRFRALALVLSSLGLSLASSASAHDTGKAQDAHVGDSSGHLITDSAGNCVQTGSWTQQQDLTDCGAPAAVTEAAPAAVASAAAMPASMPKIISTMVSLKAGTLFDVNSADLKSSGHAELTALSNQLKAMSDIQNIKIVGHTDSSGAEAYNQQLSERRAIAVKNFLLDQGIPANLMATLGMGENSPTASNATAAGRAQNRRVEITIQGKEAAIPR
jgi:OOP family OmpA-OmpF porin